MKLLANQTEAKPEMKTEVHLSGQWSEIVAIKFLLIKIVMNPPTTDRNTQADDEAR